MSEKSTRTRSITLPARFRNSPANSLGTSRTARRSQTAKTIKRIRDARTARTTTARSPRGRTTAKSGKKTIKSSKKLGFLPRRKWFTAKFNPDSTTTKRLEKRFGPKFQSIIKEEKLTARKCYKQSSDREQCIGTIGDISYDHTNCWICGIVIKDNKAETGTHPAECEHILPINDAVILLELYSQSTSENPLTKIEYAWAHTRCNQEKSNMSAIYSEGVGKGRGKIQVFKINTDPIKQVLGDIFDNKLKYKETAQPIHNDILRIYQTRQNFIEKRTAAMMKKYEIIINVISRGDRYGAASLVTLAGVAASFHPSSLNPKFAKRVYPSCKGFNTQNKRQTLSQKNRVLQIEYPNAIAAHNLLSFKDARLNTLPEGNETKDENDSARMKD